MQLVLLVLLVLLVPLVPLVPLVQMNRLDLVHNCDDTVRWSSGTI
jgi:hypothetical protein